MSGTSEATLRTYAERPDLRQQRSRDATKHGLYATHRREYMAWVNARRRCKDLTNKYYGGRGIKMCARYREPIAGAIAWCKDLGKKPLGTTIDRIDNDGHYSCGQCEECVQNGWTFNLRWATHREQQANRRV